MHICSTCGKAYSTKGTLTRHARNHEGERKYLCTECNVSFSRRDLLARHRHIHRGPNAQIRTRRRCHTACDRCRESRARCDGNCPCTQCSQNDRICDYRQANCRVSEQVMEHSPALPVNDASEESSETREKPNEAANLTCNDRDTPLCLSRQAIVRDVPIPNSPSEPQYFEVENGSNVNELQPLEDARADIDNVMTASFWPYSTAWQWTHEDLYFQGDSNMQQTADNLAELFATPSQNYHASEINHPQIGNNLALSNDMHVVEGADSSTCATPQQNGPRTRDISDSQQDQWNACLKETVNEMVDFARSIELPSKNERIRRWRYYSTRLAQSVSVEESTGLSVDQGGQLDALTDQYFRHFHPLWPLLSPEKDIVHESHPLLYLTLTSIGALYSGEAAARYGSLVHGKVRGVLLHLPSRANQNETEVLDIGRAMLLTQVAAIYFEQEGAFSAAYRLGAILNVHAHRMQLFTMKRTLSSRERSKPRTGQREDALTEGRKMLAYGMLRAETFVSVLFNTKPLISYEEVNLPLPIPDYFRVAPQSLDSPEGCGALDRHSHELLFSDLVHIALDPAEALPVMNPMEVELVLFGLQHDVWRFCHDPETFTRLIGKRHPDLPSQMYQSCENLFSASSGPADSSDRLDYSSRKMPALRKDYWRVIEALQKWKHSLTLCQLSHKCPRHRSLYLSGLLLYDLSFLRLYAPIDTIRQAAYQAHEPSAIDRAVVSEIMEWTRSTLASKAVAYARSIWLLLKAETSRPADHQSHYNILALIAVHQAAAIVWAIAGTNSCPAETFIDVTNTSSTGPTSWLLRKENVQELLLTFADMYPKITSAWGMQSSFSKMVRKLADQPFPVAKD